MPDDTRQQQFDADRARQQSDAPAASASDPSFPWAMLCLAALFDAIGWIPIINLATETLAGLIFGFWQKTYLPKSDPVLTFIIAKIIDAGFIGLLPSNIGIVVYAYIKKKAAAKIFAVA